MTRRDPTDPVAALLRHTRRVLRRLEVGPGGVVVAVSGGSDSVGLLRLLHALAAERGLRLAVAHLNHGARGPEADADAAFVAALAESLGLPCAVGSWAPDRPGHFEADARRARYRFLEAVARDRGASAVAVGHTRDDQAETILHRILRGTGPRGLAGMPARRALAEGVALVRPLLDASRAEVRAYLDTLGQPYREDRTNADPAHTRARLRHDLLPTLAADYNPRVAEALVRLGRLAAQAERARDARLAELERAIVLETGDDAVRLRRADLRSVPPFDRVELLRRVWRRLGWPEDGMDRRRWARLAALVARDPAPRTAVGGKVELRAVGEHLILRRPPAPMPPPLPRALPVPGAVAWEGGRVVAAPDPDPAAPWSERIDRDRLAGPLLVRAPRPGDRFRPLGLGADVRLAGFLRTRHFPPERRALMPLVCDADGIVWVVGHRIADRVKRTAATTRTLGLRWESS